jgi:hypothetical protein
MKNLVLIALVMLQTGCAGVTSDQANSTPTGPVASPEDFRVLSGNGWKGHLTYLDYSSGSRSQIPVEIQVDEPNGRSLSYSIKYPGETQYNSSEKIKLSRDGRKLNGDLISTRKRNSSGDLVLVTTYQGKDDNRSADIRVTYEVGRTTFAIAKEVRFEGDTDYFLRNQYLLAR